MIQCYDILYPENTLCNLTDSKHHKNYKKCQSNMYRITKAKVCNIQPQHKKSLKRGDKTYIKDNTMAKRIKSTKGQTMICKTLHRKLKIEQHEPN